MYTYTVLNRCHSLLAHHLRRHIGRHRRQPERFISIDVLKRISATSRLRSEVNRYISSAGSFIILQGINLVSVRAKDEGEVPVRSRVYRFQWQVKYRHWRNYRARKNDFRRRQFLEKKKLGSFGLSWRMGGRFSTKCMYKHVGRNTN